MRPDPKPLPTQHSLFTPDALLAEVGRRYGIAPTACKLLRSLNNDVYRLSAPEQEWILKVYGHGRVRPEEVEWEFDLLEHLRARGVACPEAIGSIERRRVEELPAPEGGRLAVLFTGIAGQKPDWPASTAVSRAYGKAFAQVHALSQDFAHQPPASRVWALEPMIDGGFGTIDRVLRGADREFARRLLERSARSLSACVAAGLDWGIVHGDVSLDNILILQDGSVAVIDFENAGVGWRAADICGARAGRVWDEFIKGYSEVRALSSDDLGAAAWFVVPFELENLRWHMEFKGLYTGSELVEGEVDATLKNLRRWEATALAGD